MLTPSLLTRIRAALHCTVTSPPDEKCLIILKDRVFMAANQMFTAEVYCQTYNQRAQYKLAVESVSMFLLRKYFGNLQTNQIKLQK